MSCGCHSQKPTEVMLTGSYGLPDPTLEGYPTRQDVRPFPANEFSPLNLLSIVRAFGLGGLGDTSAFDTLAQDYGGGSVPPPMDNTIQFPMGLDTVYPSTPPFTPSYSPAASPTVSHSNAALDNLLLSWSSAAQQILKSQSGALPTFQQTGPGGSTVYYGAGGNVPASLQTSMLSATSGSLPIILGIGLLALFMLKK